MEIVLLPQAEADLLYWKSKSNTRILKRIRVLLTDIQQHPFTGIGKPELLNLSFLHHMVARGQARCDIRLTDNHTQVRLATATNRICIQPYQTTMQKQRKTIGLKSS